MMLRRRTEPQPVSIATARGGKKRAMMHSTRHFALHGITQYSFEDDYRFGGEELCALSKLYCLLTFGVH